MAQRVLFIGGTGIISTACTHLAVERGMEVFLLNRGRSTTRPVPPEATVLQADAGSAEDVREALAGHDFDVVADFRTFVPDEVTARLELLTGRMGQYVFISSASAYQKPPARWPVTEATAVRNPYWRYSRDKIACEQLLVDAYRESGLPVTIVRPSHTYDVTHLPVDAGWTVVDRMRRGVPVVVHGDGTSLWTLTHHTDFARAFVGLLGLPAAIGQTVHITSDEALPWNEIFTTIAHAAGVEPTIVHVPSDAIAAADPDWGAGLLGDKAHSMIFDNTLIKSLVPGWVATVPFVQGAAEIIAWHDADPTRQVVDAERNALLDRLVEQFRV